MHWGLCIMKTSPLVITAVGTGGAPARFALKKSTENQSFQEKAPFTSENRQFSLASRPSFVGPFCNTWVIKGVSLQVSSVLKSVHAHTFMVFTCRAHWNFNSQWVKVLCVCRHSLAIRSILCSLLCCLWLVGLKQMPCVLTPSSHTWKWAPQHCHGPAVVRYYHRK